MTIPQHDDAAVKTSRYVLVGLTLALLAWGAFLALGSYLGGANLKDSSRRGFVVFGFMAIFLALWWILLLTKRRRPPNFPTADQLSESTKRPI